MDSEYLTSYDSQSNESGAPHLIPATPMSKPQDERPPQVPMEATPTLNNNDNNSK